MRIVQELNIANLEHHMQRKPQACIFEHLRSTLLCRRKRRNLTRRAEPCKGLDKVRVPLCVHTAIGPGLLVDHGLPDVLLLTDRDFAFPVKVPVRLCKRLDDVWRLPLQSVENVVRADDVTLAALERARDAQQSDDVAIICVEELPSRCAVDADFVDLCRIRTSVLHESAHVPHHAR